jgi:tetratricopeptide (TPR) repeat protein
LGTLAAVALGQLQIKTEEAKLRQPGVYEPVAKRLALYCQSDPKFFSELLSGAWLPDELAQIGNDGMLTVGPNFASVEMGGGFHHFGYQLSLDQRASTPIIKTWRLTFYSEDARPETMPLTTLQLPAADHLEADALLKLVLAGFDRAAAQNPNDKTAPSGKIFLLLRFGKLPEAAMAGQDWIQRRPDFWLPRFATAHLRSRLGEYDAAARDYAAWTQAHPSFSHAICLALFNHREGSTPAALKAVRLALEQPFVEPLDGSAAANKFYLGHNGAIMAVLAGDYDLSLAMCDKMLADPADDKWWKVKILKLRAAVMLTKGNQAAAREDLRRAQAVKDASRIKLPVNASDAQFEAAIETNDTVFVKTPANWLDQSDGWFNPFNIGVVGGEARDHQIPTIYPKSWPSDLMKPAKLDGKK